MLFLELAEFVSQLLFLVSQQCKLKSELIHNIAVMCTEYLSRLMRSSRTGRVRVDNCSELDLFGWYSPSSRAKTPYQSVLKSDDD